jgi:predicted DNA-binding transcriptional regulator AlpA
MNTKDIDLRSAKEIADLLGITVTCLIAWRRKRIGPPYMRIGTRRVAYDMRDVTTWLNAQKHQSVA